MLWPSPPMRSISGSRKDAEGELFLVKEDGHYEIVDSRRGWGKLPVLSVYPHYANIDEHYVILMEDYSMDKTFPKLRIKPIGVAHSPEEADSRSYEACKVYCQKRVEQDNKLTKFTDRTLEEKV